MRSKRTTFASSLIALVACVTVSFVVLGFSGCDNAAAKADRNDDVAGPDVAGPVGDTSESVVAVSESEDQSAEPVGLTPQDKPDRLKRGEMPVEWREPQRERVVPIDRTGDKLDLTFDDLKFDIEVGQAFERSLLSEEVKSLDGKEITLSGYMRPSFKSTGLKGFIFVRDDKECCFGPQAAIYDCVRVYLKKGTTSDYIVRPFKVRGKFYLKEKEGPDGAIWSIFNMKSATIVQ